LIGLAKFFGVSAVPLVFAIVMTWQVQTLPGVTATVAAAGPHDGSLDRALRAKLASHGFTGNIEHTFKKRLKASLGRPIDPQLAELGRLLWFDNLHSNGRDNTCGGCHSPTNGMGDSQPMAIGAQSNLTVGPGRSGPRNQRRAPTVVNNALFPRLMWNNRFEALSGDPFDGSLGFRFPIPEGDTRFSPEENEKNDLRHLLQAQAQIPPTELIEVGGFKDACNHPDLASTHCQFDMAYPNDHPALPIPAPDPSTGSRNEPLRQAALRALNASPEYRKLFGKVFKDVRRGAPIDFFHFGKAIAEFEFTLVFANAPIDRFARGQKNAMTDSEKRGALLFFGRAGCVSCHSVKGKSNEMFSDFQEHVAAAPQVFPTFGWPTGNFIFSGDGRNEDFGRAEVDSLDHKYKFRTAPLRNLAVSAGFFHNGSFTTLEGVIRYHLNTLTRAPLYDPRDEGVPEDLQQVGPTTPLDLLEPRLVAGRTLTDRQFRDLVQFVKTGLLDERVLKSNLCGLIPARVPSGLPVLTFEGCQRR
jgi:cytochrome c peroxidase